MLVTPAHARLKQKDCKFWVSLGNIISPSLKNKSPQFLIKYGRLVLNRTHISNSQEKKITPVYVETKVLTTIQTLK